MIKALLIDEQPLMRAGLNQILSRTTDIRIISSTKYGQEALRKARMNFYDVIIMNVDLPKRQGLDYLRKIKKFISPLLAEKIAFDSIEEKALHERLSKREYEVMCAIACGKTLREIAREMSLSAKTISTNRARIMRKMKMNSNAELMRYAIKEELVD